MAWRSLEITVSAEHAEALSDALLEAGATSVAISDAAAGTGEEEPLYGEPGMTPAHAWATSKLSALFESGTDVEAALHSCAGALGLGAVPAHQVIDVADADWVRLTQAQFEPIAITDRLWIVPSWHTCPDPRAVAIILDPGLAFGTGSHPTTRLCLAWLAANLRGGEAVLDYGCGSGILAIAALKLGGRRALGVDIDPQAIAAARDNAARNEVAAEFADATARLDFQADIVIANILANPLKLIAPILAGHCVTGGTLVLSGVLAGQAGDVTAAYRHWFELVVGDTDDGWVSLVGTRNAKQVTGAPC
jgi:ribosomal protein L11 methyltransferase